MLILTRGTVNTSKKTFFIFSIKSVNNFAITKSIYKDKKNDRFKNESFY